jgi:cyclopropane fatty-acyl-phospholipid synthase-like methyltransferase
MSPARTQNINSSFFDGYYKDIWRAIIPEALTKAEVDYVVSEGELKAGSKVLDLMCGYGRHALSLARKGMNVTAIDNLTDYIDEIKQIAEKESLPLSARLLDVMQFQSEDQYDLIMCMGNSVCFFDKDDSEKLYSRISNTLKKGGKFIFNSWMIAEIAITQFKEKAWTYVGEIKFLSDSKYLFHPSRIEAESIFIAPDGSTERKMGVDYIYSLDETEAMLNKSGLVINEIWSIPGKKKFTLGEPRIYIVAGKAAD